MTLMFFGLVLPDDESRTACLNKLVCAPFDIPRTCAHAHARTNAHTHIHSSDRHVFSFMAVNERQIKLCFIQKKTHLGLIP
jgi:hypothetical protein